MRINTGIDQSVNLGVSTLTATVVDKLMQSPKTIALTFLLTVSSGIFCITPVFAQTTSNPNDNSQFNCLSQYPKTPVQGDRAISRNEFAVGLDNCLNELKQRFNLEGYATKTDLEMLTQRQQELNQELRELRNRVDVTGESN